jgi:hypothetical protein
MTSRLGGRTAGIRSHGLYVLPVFIACVDEVNMTARKSVNRFGGRRFFESQEEKPMKIILEALH